MNEVDRPGFWKRFYGMFSLDWVFGILFLISIMMLILENMNPEPMIEIDPILKIGLLFVLMLVIAIAAGFASAVDRKKAEDYYFQLMTSGAIVAVVTTLFVNLVWDLIYGPLRGDDVIAIMLGSWSLGYFFYRMRGLNT